MHLHSRWNSLIVRGGRMKRGKKRSSRKVVSVHSSRPPVWRGKKCKQPRNEISNLAQPRLGKVFESESFRLERFFVVGRRGNFPL